MEKVKAAIIGNGNISPVYLSNLTDTFSDIVEVKGVCDLIPERSEKASDDWDVPVIYETMYDAFKDDEIEIIVNLTRPYEHYGVAIEALHYGKNTHSEKPMSVGRGHAKEIFNLGRESGLLVGVAPDTFMGGGIQTCREILDSGEIGEPIGASAYMTCHGHESWHPDPEFYYQEGGGPMLDMGPYYVTALVNLLGPVERLCGISKIMFPTRTITSEKKYGKIVPVEAHTHVTGLMEFKNGAVGSIITSFDMWKAEHPFIEIYGTKGSMQVPDPNGFGGPVRIQIGTEDWKEVPVTRPYTENSRGVGVWDMARALRLETPHRPNSTLAYHVLDIMLGFRDSSETNGFYVLQSECERPEPMEA
ncbi:MAG: Gfo/Idh/MocA family oxidoreductase [Oscillospiraceae bacterium]|nr:Gfo/Idh/MocA family oxidoreductase [Oscillospiraceae bacterium]